MQPNTISSLQDFLHISRSYNNGDLLLSAEAQLAQLTDTKYKQNSYSPALFMLDFTTGEYVFIRSNVRDIVGYDAKNFLEGGFDFYMNTWHQKDFDLYNKEIFPACVNFLKQYKHQQDKKLIFSRNNRLITKGGGLVTVLQRFSFILDPIHQQPIGTIGSVTDITHFASDKLITLTIEEANKSDTTNSQVKLLFKNHYYFDKGEATLTKREIEVLKWLCEGLSSKQAADKMFISIDTIHNHRKNMLKKMNCNNAAELVSFALKNGII